MKAKLFAMFVALLMVGCGGPDDEENSFGWSDANKPASTGVIDLDDKDTLNEILAEAINYKKITDDYTGWAKRIWDNGQIKALGQIKAGKEDGLWMERYENGNKLTEVNYKAGKMVGVATLWHENGQKQSESNYKDGKLMSAIIWRPDGEKCPVTNLKDGNGVVVYYNLDGTEDFRITYKNGESQGRD